jgi:hypothetical protein
MEPDDRLDEARQHLAEASEHIAHAVEQLAVEEHLAAGPDSDDRDARRTEKLHRRKDGLAVTYKRLQKIQDDLHTLQADEAAPAPDRSH